MLEIFINDFCVIVEPGVGFGTVEMTLDFVSGAVVGSSSIAVII